VAKVEEALFLRKLSDVRHVFIKDGRLHIGVSDGMGLGLFGFFYHKFRGNIVVVNFLWRGLGDFPVLAKLALKIAPHRGQREGGRPGKDMKEGFLFDWIEVNCAWVAIDKAVVLSAPVLTHSAKTPLPIGYTAPPGAQFTLNLSSVEGSEIGRELRADKALLGYLCLQFFGETQEVNAGEDAETHPAES